jgi:hypothetical protein
MRAVGFTASTPESCAVCRGRHGRSGARGKCQARVNWPLQRQSERGGVRTWARRRTFHGPPRALVLCLLSTRQDPLLPALLPGNRTQYQLLAGTTVHRRCSRLKSRARVPWLIWMECYIFSECLSQISVTGLVATDFANIGQMRSL